MDVQHSPPKGWKAFQANFDFVFSQSDRLCSVCLSQQQIQAILSQIEYLYWPTRWVKADGDVDADVVTQFTEDLERQLMMACCDDNLPIQWRYTSDGVLQQSLNGGGTWTDAPLYDPRVYSTLFPPLPGDVVADKKCAAATGAALLVKEQIGDQLTDDMSRYTLSQLISDWTRTVIDTSNPFLALVTVVTNQIFALVIAVLRPALTDDVYHQLTCAFDCNMADDVSFNLAQWQAVRTYITTNIAGIAGIFLEHLVYLLGTQGITNLCRSGAASTGDCSDCCPEIQVYRFDECSATTPQLLTPVGGVYTLVGDCFHSGGGFTGYLADIIFTSDPTIPVPGSTCSLIDNVTPLTGSPTFAFRLNCDRTLVFDWGDAVAYQYRSPDPFTLTFTIFGA